jgi:hypothetical protein
MNLIEKQQRALAHLSEEDKQVFLDWVPTGEAYDGLMNTIRKEFQLTGDTLKSEISSCVMNIKKYKAIDQEKIFYCEYQIGGIYTVRLKAIKANCQSLIKFINTEHQTFISDLGLIISKPVVVGAWYLVSFRVGLVVDMGKSMVINEIFMCNSL